MVRGIKAGLAVGAVLVAGAVPASALGTSGAALYPSEVNARSFVTGDGGWERGTESSGLCVAPLTCPTVGGGFVASGGTLGESDGYLRTTISGLTGVGSESRGILRGPAFTYSGVEGQRATDLLFAVSHLADLEALLSVAGNSADLSVDIVKVGGNARRVVTEQPLIADGSWTDDGVVQLNPGSLTIGQQYRIRLITRFAYGAEVLPGGSVGYDDVGLLAIRDDGGGAKDDDDSGGATRPGGNSAVFDGRNLFLKLRCFGEQGKNGKCHTRATALKAKRGKRVTFPIQRVVKAKNGKVIRARVRFRFRKQLERSRSIVLKSVLTEGRKDKSKTVKHKKLRLIKRGS